MELDADVEAGDMQRLRLALCGNVKNRGLVSVEATVERGRWRRNHSTSFTTGTRPEGSINASR
jgi:hypothetical protein